MFRVLSLALVACLLMAGSAFADMKIGVFNSQAVAMDSDAAKAAQQKLQSQFGAEKTQLEKQAKDLQSKGEALQAQVAKMSAKEREDKQMEFLRLRRAFEEKSRNFARKVENTENQIRQSMAQQIYDAATTIAKQQKLDLILDAAAGSVMFIVIFLIVSFSDGLKKPTRFNTYPSTMAQMQPSAFCNTCPINCLPLFSKTYDLLYHNSSKSKKRIVCFLLFYDTVR